MSNVAALRPDPADRFTYSRITVEPVTPVIGAEISGVDLRQPIDAETAADIQKALHDWRVVFFRDQDISNDELKAFGRAFRTEGPYDLTVLEAVVHDRTNHVGPTAPDPKTEQQLMENR